MSLLSRYTALEVTKPGDAAALRDVLSAVGSVDGSVDALERTVIEALFHTIPQLREETSKVPPRTNRAQILAQLEKVTDERLRRQCFVLAVELAVASGGVNEAEDAYLGSLQKALAIDAAFAEATVQVMAAKYTRGTE